MSALTLEDAQYVEQTPHENNGIARRVVITLLVVALFSGTMVFGAFYTFGWRASVATALPASNADRQQDLPIRHSGKTLEVSLQ